METASCCVKVWGDGYYPKLIYISVKQENVLTLPVQTPVGPAGKLSNAISSCINFVVFEQSVLHVTADVWLTAESSGCMEKLPRVNV